MATLTERDGRYWNGTDDWGAVVLWGTVLECCGCTLDRLARAEICDDCPCHDSARFIMRVPFNKDTNAR